MWDWLKGAIGEILRAFQTLIDMASPGSAMEYALSLVVAMLPAPIDVSMVTTGLRIVVGFLAPYILALDYFIDMMALSAVLLWMATIEFGTFFFRLWRTVRSTLT